MVALSGPEHHQKPSLAKVMRPQQSLVVLSKNCWQDNIVNHYESSRMPEGGKRCLSMTLGKFVVGGCQAALGRTWLSLLLDVRPCMPAWVISRRSTSSSRDF